MTDRRLIPSNGRVAHASLKGAADAETFVDGRRMTVAATLARLTDEPDGRLERELLFGDAFLCLEERSGFAFGVSEKDGYVGTVEARLLADSVTPTHVVATRATHALEVPDIKVPGESLPLSLGSRVRVVGSQGAWSEIAMPEHADRFVPTVHLRPLSAPISDPVGFARSCLGTPYVWGGNTTWGIDCSGPVQLAYHMAGFACAADSDQQEAMPGAPIGNAGDLAAGDLVFWRGHVGMATNAGTMLHANAYHMQVVEEPTDEAIRRIGAGETGDVTSMLRPEKRPLTPDWPQTI